MSTETKITPAERLEAEVARRKAMRRETWKEERLTVDPVDESEFAAAINALRAHVGDSVLSEEEYTKVLSEQATASRAAIWAQVCPDLYREPFDLALCKSTRKEDVRRVLDWRFGPRGLYVIGASGTSKSRAVATALTRAFMSGRSVLFEMGVEFAIKAGATMCNPDEAMKSPWLRGMYEADIVWLDDMGKRWTPATEEAAFLIVEHRTARRKPIVVTTNFTGDEMQARAADLNTVTPLLRRLRDYTALCIF